MGEEMTRREFIGTAAVLTAGAAVTGLSGCVQADQDAPTEVATPSRTFEGGNKMSGRVLVGYATRTGSTVGVAEKIGAVLSQRGFDVDVKPIRERPSLEGYDAAIIGSAINGAAWLPEAMSYIEANSSALSHMPVCVFCVHSMNGGTDAKQTKKRIAYLDKVRAVLKPTDEGYFLGKGPDPEDTSLIARWAFKAFGGSGEGDMRDWNKIRVWAEQAHV